MFGMAEDLNPMIHTNFILWYLQQTTSMGHAVVVHLPVIPVFQQIPPQFPAMLNTRTHPRPDGLASVSAKNVEIPSEKHKTKNSAKVAGIDGIRIGEQYLPRCFACWKILFRNSSEWWQHWPIHPPQNYCIHIVIKWKLFPNWGQNFRIGFFLTPSVLK